MRKTDKKLENQLIAILTDVCESSLKSFVGFQWITHFVNYSNFPKSLQVVCVFDTQDNLTGFIGKGGEREMLMLIEQALLKIGISSQHVAHLLAFDTEENGAKDGRVTIAIN